ncbi:MAG: hypothetical protein IKT79_03670, partial [Akkermansia sp.]|nr:hypothetical protein [Akkermansia sp.]
AAQAVTIGTTLQFAIRDTSWKFRHCFELLQRCVFVAAPSIDRGKVNHKNRASPSKEAMAILSCSRATVDVVAAKHAIPTQKHSNVRPCGNGATAFMYFRRDDVIMAAKLRAIKKNKSRKK